MNLIDPEKTKLAMPIAAVFTTLAVVTGGVWWAASIKGDISHAITDHGEELHKINESLIELNKQVRGLANDHVGLVSRSELRLVLRQLESLNEPLLREGGQKGLRIPPQD